MNGRAYPKKQLVYTNLPLVVKHDTGWVKYYFRFHEERERFIRRIQGLPYKRLPIQHGSL